MHTRRKFDSAIMAGKPATLVELNEKSQVQVVFDYTINKEECKRNQTGRMWGSNVEDEKYSTVIVCYAVYMYCNC
jgi:hypothetical protein